MIFWWSVSSDVMIMLSVTPEQSQVKSVIILALHHCSWWPQVETMIVVHPLVAQGCSSMDQCWVQVTGHCIPQLWAGSTGGRMWVCQLTLQQWSTSVSWCQVIRDIEEYKTVIHTYWSMAEKEKVSISIPHYHRTSCAHPGASSPVLHAKTIGLETGCCLSLSEWSRVSVSTVMLILADTMSTMPGMEITLS